MHLPRQKNRFLFPLQDISGQFGDRADLERKKFRESLAENSTRSLSDRWRKRHVKEGFFCSGKKNSFESNTSSHRKFFFRELFFRRSSKFIPRRASLFLLLLPTAGSGGREGEGYSRLFFDGSVRPPIEKRPSLPIPFRRLTFCIIDSSSFSFFLPSSVRSAIGHLSMGKERQNGGGGRGLPLRKRRGGPKVRYDDDGGREKKAKRKVEDNFLFTIFSGVFKKVSQDKKS